MDFTQRTLTKGLIVSEIDRLINKGVLTKSKGIEAKKELICTDIDIDEWIDKYPDISGLIV